MRWIVFFFFFSGTWYKSFTPDSTNQNTPYKKKENTTIYMFQMTISSTRSQISIMTTKYPLLSFKELTEGAYTTSSRRSFYALTAWRETFYRSALFRETLSSFHHKNCISAPNAYSSMSVIVHASWFVCIISHRDKPAECVYALLGVNAWLFASQWPIKHTNVSQFIILKLKTIYSRYITPVCCAK